MIKVSLERMDIIVDEDSEKSRLHKRFIVGSPHATYEWYMDAYNNNT